MIKMVDIQRYTSGVIVVSREYNFDVSINNYMLLFAKHYLFKKTVEIKQEDTKIDGNEKRWYVEYRRALIAAVNISQKLNCVVKDEESTKRYFEAIDSYTAYESTVVTFFSWLMRANHLGRNKKEYASLENVLGMFHKKLCDKKDIGGSRAKAYAAHLRKLCESSGISIPKTLSVNFTSTKKKRDKKKPSRRKRIGHDPSLLYELWSRFHRDFKKVELGIPVILDEPRSVGKSGKKQMELSYDEVLRYCSMFDVMVIFVNRQSDCIIRIYPKDKSRLSVVKIGEENALKLERVKVNNEKEKRKRGGQKNEDEIYVLEAKNLPIDPYTVIKEMMEKSQEISEKYYNEKKENKYCFLFKAIHWRTKKFTKNDFMQRGISEELKTRMIEILKEDDFPKEILDSIPFKIEEIVSYIIRTMTASAANNLKKPDGNKAISQSQIATQGDWSTRNKHGELKTYIHQFFDDLVNFSREMLVKVNDYFIENFEQNSFKRKNTHKTAMSEIKSVEKVFKERHKKEIKEDEYFQEPKKKKQKIEFIQEKELKVPKIDPSELRMFKKFQMFQQFQEIQQFQKYQEIQKFQEFQKFNKLQDIKKFQ